VLAFWQYIGMTNQTTAFGPEIIAAIVAMADQLGRPFEASDLTVGTKIGQRLFIRAAEYAATCLTDELPFMRDMAVQVNTRSRVLSAGQAKGILNVLVSRGRRAAAPKAPLATVPAANLTSLPDGRYRVTLPDNSDRALMIRKSDWAVEKFGEGSRMISLRTGSDDWTGQGVVLTNGTVKFFSKTGQAVRQSVEVLAQATAKDEWLVLGQAFAQAGGQCFICGRELDTRESLAVGYGPVCADKNGLPWGEVSTPTTTAPATAPVVGGEAEAAAPIIEAPTAAVKTTAWANQEAELKLSPAEVAAKIDELVSEGMDRSKATRYVEIFDWAS